MSKGRKPEVGTVVPFKGDDGFSVEERHRLEAEKLCPANLDDDLQEVWDRLAPELSLRGRLKPHFVDVVEEYCRAIARMKKLRASLLKEGETYTTYTRNGEQIKTRPEVAQLNETWRQWRSIVGMLGLSPADERGLAASQGDLFDDPFEQF